MSVFDDMSDEEKAEGYLFFYENNPFVAVHPCLIPQSRDSFFKLIPGTAKERRLKEFLECFRKNSEKLRLLPYAGIPDEILYRFCFSKRLFFQKKPSRSEMIARMLSYCDGCCRNDVKKFLRSSIKELEEHLRNGTMLDFDSSGLGLEAEIEDLIQRWDQSIENRKNYRVKKILLEKFAEIKKKDQAIYRLVLGSEPDVYKEWQTILNGGILPSTPEYKAKELWVGIRAKCLALTDFDVFQYNSKMFFLEKIKPVTIYRDHILILQCDGSCWLDDFMKFLFENMNVICPQYELRLKVNDDFLFFEKQKCVSFDCDLSAILSEFKKLCPKEHKKLDSWKLIYVEQPCTMIFTGRNLYLDDFPKIPSDVHIAEHSDWKIKLLFEGYTIDGYTISSSCDMISPQEKAVEFWTKCESKCRSDGSAPFWLNSVSPVKLINDTLFLEAPPFSDEILLTKLVDETSQKKCILKLITKKDETELAEKQGQTGNIPDIQVFLNSIEEKFREQEQTNLNERKNLQSDIHTWIQSEKETLWDSLRQLVTKEIERYDIDNAKVIEIAQPDMPNKVIGIAHMLTEQIAGTCKLGIPQMLVGPAGGGKTTCAAQIAHILNLEYFPMSVGAQTTKSDLLGFIDANGNYHPTVIRKAFENGGLLFLDELDAANAGVMTILNALLANGYCSFPDKVVSAHENFRCIAACNTYGRGADRMYVGRNQLDAATLDRFAVVDFDYDEKMERKISGNAVWAKQVQVWRRRLFDLKERFVITPRASVYGARLLAAGMVQKQVEELVVWKGIPETLKKKIKGEKDHGNDH